jgi:membrane associated rhomboid family serine protease
MFPLRDVIPSRTFPGVVIVLITLNALAFFFEQSLTDRELRMFLLTWGLIPRDFDMVTVFSSMFLHGSWMHIIGNMVFLWIFGDNIEDRMGHGRFIVFYLLCGTIAGFAHVLSEPGSPVPTIGASGAVAAVMGAYFVLYPHSRVLTVVFIFLFIDVVEVPAVLFLGLWFLMQLFNGVGALLSAGGQMAGGIAFWAHVAGFVSGMVLVKAFARPERGRVEWWNDRPYVRMR